MVAPCIRWVWRRRRAQASCKGRRRMRFRRSTRVGRSREDVGEGWGTEECVYIEFVGAKRLRGYWMASKSSAALCAIVSDDNRIAPQLSMVLTWTITEDDFSSISHHWTERSSRQPRYLNLRDKRQSISAVTVLTSSPDTDLKPIYDTHPSDPRDLPKDYHHQNHDQTYIMQSNPPPLRSRYPFLQALLSVLMTQMKTSSIILSQNIFLAHLNLLIFRFSYQISKSTSHFLQRHTQQHVHSNISVSSTYHSSCYPAYLTFHIHKKHMMDWNLLESFCRNVFTWYALRSDR